MTERKSITQTERGRLHAHMAAERLARAAQALCLIAGAIGAVWHGFASILLGVAGAAVFHMARPGPSDELDKITGRRD